MAATVDHVLTVGNLRQTWRWTVRDPDGSLATLTAATVKMVNVADNSVKIAAGVATITNPGVATYQPVAGDVDTAGIFAVWLHDVTAGKPQDWPDNGRTRLIQFVVAG